VAHLGRLPLLGELTSDALAVAFQASIRVDLIREALAQGEMA
jgi:dethiobiotin synthetase